MVATRSRTPTIATCSNAMDEYKAKLGPQCLLGLSITSVSMLVEHTVLNSFVDQMFPKHLYHPL